MNEAMERKYLSACGAAILAIVIFTVLSAGCTSAPVRDAGPGSGQGYGPAADGGQGAGAGPGTAAVTPSLLPRDNADPLTKTEAADILFMREEEQLAHDLYVRWGGIFAVPIFSNIAASETTHLGEVQLLIDRYGIPGRIGNASSGFTAPAIQALHDQLGPMGDASATGAFESGLAVEEQDIADLDRVAANTTRADVRQVYANLRQGSENHRSAFLRQLGR